MKRNYQVKIKGFEPFTMGGLEPDEDAQHVCFSIWGDRLEWVE